MKGRDVLFSTGKDDWQTPEWLFKAASRFYGPFTLDLAASYDNTLCERFYSEEDDALIQDWSNENSFCNPPYSLADRFIDHAVNTEFKLHKGCTMLLPVRSSNKSWKGLSKTANELMFIIGRLKFKGAKSSAPFPSCLVRWVNEGKPSYRIEIHWIEAGKVSEL